MKNFVKVMVVLIILTVIKMLNTSTMAYSSPVTIKYVKPKIEFIDTTYQGFDTLQMNNRKNKLVNTVNKYLQDINAPKEITGEFIVSICLENNFDITFLLAQGTIETAMGNTGVGKKTGKRSIFGIINKSWNSYEVAISDYIALIKRSYMGNKRTFNDLMNNFVNLSGYRYAGNRNYERVLRNQYNSITQKYGINNLQYDFIMVDDSTKRKCCNDSAII